MLPRRGRDRESSTSLPEIITKCPKFPAIERQQHDRQRLDGRLAEQPGDHPRIDARVFSKRQPEVLLGRIAGAIEEQQIDEVSRFGA